MIFVPYELKKWTRDFLYSTCRAKQENFIQSKEREKENLSSKCNRKKTALVVVAVDQSESLGLKQGCLTVETLTFVEFNSHAG